MAGVPTTNDAESRGVTLGGPELINLENEVRTLQRQSRNILGAGFAAASLALAFASQLSLELGFVLLTLLWGLAIAWHFNVEAEAAAVAEARDALARKVNGLLEFEVHTKEVIGNVGRGSKGTVFASAIIGTLLIGSQFAAFLNLWSPMSFVDGSGVQIGHLDRGLATGLQAGATILVFAAVLVAWGEVERYRGVARQSLRHREEEVPVWAPDGVPWSPIATWAIRGGYVGAGLLASTMIVLTVWRYDGLIADGWSPMKRNLVQWPSVMLLSEGGGLLASGMVLAGVLIALMGIFVALRTGVWSDRVASVFVAMSGYALALLSDPPAAGGVGAERTMHDDVYLALLGFCAIAAAFVAWGLCYREERHLWRWVLFGFLVLGIGLGVLVDAADGISQLARTALIMLLFVWVAAFSFFQSRRIPGPHMTTAPSRN